MKDMKDVMAASEALEKFASVLERLGDADLSQMATVPERFNALEEKIDALLKQQLQMNKAFGDLLTLLTPEE